MADSLRGSAHLQRELGDELFGYLVNPKNTGEVRELAEGFRRKEEAMRLPEPLSFFEAVDALSSERGPYSPEVAFAIVSKWRLLGISLGYSGCFAWRMKAGFTMSLARDIAGGDNRFAADWRFADNPTEEAVVFWVPRFIGDSTRMNEKRSRRLLGETRSAYGLPDHHLADFGEAVHQSALILGHHKRTGERVPLDGQRFRTQSRRFPMVQRALGFFDDAGLHWADLDDEIAQLQQGCGVFPIGIEPLAT